MTGRLPFDPKKMAAAKPRATESAPAPKASDAPITVSQLAGRIGSAIAAGLPDRVRVIGQVSGFRERTHWYFDLKDAESIVNCVVFASAAKRIRFTPTIGQEVVLSGRVEFYGKQGRVTLIADRVEPVGAGALDIAFRRLVEEIRALGWFDDSRKRPMPAFPQRVAIVTSRTGAALQDVLDTLRRRSPWVDVLLLDARVQGEGAAQEVADAISWLGAHYQRLAIDAILVTRGGGSMEDLWAFNERIVAEAIVRSPVAVIAAIGHETDTTIAELVADLRCATPTQAAMRLAPDRAALLDQLSSLQSHLRAAIARTTDRSRDLDQLARHLKLAMVARLRERVRDIEELSSRLERQRPVAVLASRRARLDRAGDRLNVAARAAVERHDLRALDHRLRASLAIRVQQERSRFEAIARQLDAVGPQRVLARGFSYTRREDGTLVRSRADARPGDRLLTRVSDGDVRSIVDGSAPSRVREASSSPRPQVSSGDEPPQLDLFAADR